MQAPPEEGKAVMDAWMSWAQKNGPALVDLGTPLGNSRRISPDSTGASNGDIVGYSIMQAVSLDEVTAKLRDHPHLNMPGGCTIEVHEALSLPM